MTAIERRDQCLKCEFEKTKGIGDFRDMYCTYYAHEDKKIDDAYFCQKEKEYQISTIRKGERMFKNNCEYCEGAKALVIGKTDNQGIALKYPNILIAYGYDVHGYGSNGLTVRIKFCPMCGRKLTK